MHRQNDTVTLSLVDAPQEAIGEIKVGPTHLTLWVTDHELRRVGFQGNIVAGPGRDSGGHVAYVWPVEKIPAWAQDLARDYLDGKGR